MPRPFLKRLHWLLAGTIASTAQAMVYPLPPPSEDVIGEIKIAYARKEETLLDIARTHSLGYDEIVHANPGVDRWAPGEGTPIVLPTRYILPDTPREGLVLNVAEMRLYYYPPASAGGERVVHTYPVSIGRMDWKTPLGSTKVVAKEVDPAWRPPASIKAEHAREGDILPDVVPGGPDNPLGRYAMRLGVPGYLIHSTNKPFGIGMRVTHGCVRMYPEDIEGLFGMVPVGTTVRLIDQPVKVGRLNGELLVESHEPLEEDNLPMKVTLEQAQRAVIAKTGPDMPGVDQTALQAAVEQVSGMPVSISAEPGSTPAESMASQSPAAPADYPTANRIPDPAPAIPPGQYAPSASTGPSGSAPNYPATNRTPSSYPAPYDGSSTPPTAYRPAPAPPSRYAPYGSPTASYDELPHRPAVPAAPPVDTPAYRPSAAPPVDTPAYRPSAAPPVDTPAYRPSAAPPRYTRSPEDADYREPPYLYPRTTAPLPPSAAIPPDYRSIPANPEPYPRDATSPIRPSTDDAPVEEPLDEPLPARRL